MNEIGAHMFVTHIAGGKPRPGKVTTICGKRVTHPDWTFHLDRLPDWLHRPVQELAHRIPVCQRCVHVVMAERRSLVRHIKTVVHDHNQAATCLNAILDMVRPDPMVPTALKEAINEMMAKALAESEVNTVITDAEMEHIYAMLRQEGGQ